ncbi:peroxidasin homolog [Metopolophium dirhodum]|uniref:peroxidasin homolog n=1 Tax=Metopolophium dirhodum TaxID=44670 RepID=UPI0029901694|nr:peroxidasin homolog [Metopolophium dirhodum]
MTRPMHQDAAAAAFLRRTMALLLLLLVFSSLSSFPSVNAECPDKCTCIGTNVRCSFQQLDRIPDRISPATTELNLSYNKIRDIEPKSLTHLTELKTLMLSYNNISDVKNGAFANLSKLRRLLLYKNNIENIETRVFNDLTSLESLFLHHNKIHKLDFEMFKGLTKLNILFLHTNMIRKIPPGIFDSLTSLGRLRLDNNPLTCDCDILWFVNVLNTTDFSMVSPTCNFPDEINKKYLMEITEDDFHCSSPDVTVVPENKTVSVGEQLQLSCKAVGDPEPFITWAKDDKDLELDQRVQVFQNNTLIISKVERTDGGQYKCVASNSLGRKSFEAMVNVNDLAENGCNTMFGVIPCFFFIIIILANCVLYNDIL